MLSRAGVRVEGPAFVYPGGLLQRPDGSLLVTDEGADALLRVDLATGDRTLRTPWPWWSWTSAACSWAARA